LLIINSEKLDVAGWMKNKTKLDKTLQAILKWDNDRETDCCPASQKEYPFFPTDIAAEKEAVQPILGLLRALSHISAD
jgi:hypothetical protein